MPGWNESAWFSIFVGVALKSTVVLGAAWLAAFLLRGRSAAARHLVWTAAAAAVLALPFLSVWLPALPVAVAGALLPDDGVFFQTDAPNAGATSWQAPQRSGALAQAQPGRAWGSHWRLWLMLVWAAGAAASLIQVLFAYRGMRRLRRSAKPSPHRHLIAQLAQALGIGPAVEVLETDEGVMPMTFGILRPAVLMPREAANWSEERQRIVLLHELAHVRRGDMATQFLARLSLILNWWNPLAWTAWSEFLKERERATDDLVLHTGACASDYAGHLLEVARTLQADPGLGWAALAMARGPQLEGRLRAILDSRVRRKAAGRASAFAVALAAIGIAGPLAAVRAQEKPPALQERVASKQSIEYGAGLLKIADLEKTRHRPEEAEAFYAKAAQALGDRPEAVPALIYLGLRKNNPEEAIEYFQKAQRLDPLHAGPALMWMALIREREQKPAEAESLYKSALAVEKPDSAEAADTSQLYARFLNGQGREEEGRAMLDRATAVRKELFQKEATQLPIKAGTNVLRIGDGVKPPALISKVEPEYTQEARFAKHQGKVVVYAEIGPDGMAGSMRIVQGIGFGLDENAIRAISNWRFQPGTKDGVAVTVAATIEVNYRLL